MQKNARRSWITEGTSGKVCRESLQSSEKCQLQADIVSFAEHGLFILGFTQISNNGSCFPPEVDGMLESWILKLATALKSNLIDVNVVITDWLCLAQTHYPTAAKSTRSVGKDIAHLLQALQVRQYQRKKTVQATRVLSAKNITCNSNRCTTNFHLRRFIWLATALEHTSLDLLGATWKVQRKLGGLQVSWAV